MRLALTLYDESGAVEVASVDCDSGFVSGCRKMEYSLGMALQYHRHNVTQPEHPVSTALAQPATLAIMYTISRLGEEVDLPVCVSC